MVGTQTEGCNVPEKLSLSGTPFAHSSIMFRNNGIRYNEKFARGKDLDLMLRLSKQGKIKTLSNCCIKYTVNNDLKRKIKDCSWHRKVILANRWFDREWYIDYWNVLRRQIRLIYYDKIKNIIFNNPV